MDKLFRENSAYTPVFISTPREPEKETVTPDLTFTGEVHSEFRRKSLEKLIKLERTEPKRRQSNAKGILFISKSNGEGAGARQSKQSNKSRIMRKDFSILSSSLTNSPLVRNRSNSPDGPKSKIPTFRPSSPIIPEQSSTGSSQSSL